MKFVFGAIEAAILVALGLALGSWAAGMLREADDVSNVVGLVGGVGGAAALVYAFVKRVEFYVNG